MWISSWDKIQQFTIIYNTNQRIFPYKFSHNNDIEIIIIKSSKSSSGGHLIEAFCQCLSLTNFIKLLKSLHLIG